MGSDSSGTTFKSIEEFWESVIGKDGQSSHEWYKKTRDVWQQSEDSIEGVLQGYGNVDGVDIEASLKFLDTVFSIIERNGAPHNGFRTGAGRRRRALDCGAGVGRVTKNCLLQKFELVDLVELVEKYLLTAKEYIGSQRVVSYYNSSLQDMQLEHTYDCIWIQWSILYLTDDDLVSFLKRCSAFIAVDGFICVKENVVLNSKFYVDLSDNSIMRTDDHYRNLFKKSGLEVIIAMKQPKFPKGLFPVMMYGLRPASCGTAFNVRESLR